MTIFSATSVESSHQATDLINSASGKHLLDRVDYPPFIEEAIAGAAIALEKGHPNALRISRDSTAQDWMRIDGFEGLHFHASVKRLVDDITTGKKEDISPKSMMEQIVAHTVLTTSAHRMLLAVSSYGSGRNNNIDSVMTEDLNNHQVGKIQDAINNPDEKAVLGDEMGGNFHFLPEGRQRAIDEEIATLRSVSPIARDFIENTSAGLEIMRTAGQLSKAQIDENIANFKEEGTPLFGRVTTDKDQIQSVVQRHQDIFSGKENPMNEVEAGVLIHIKSMGIKEHEHQYDEIMAPEARANIMLQILGTTPDMAEKDPMFRSPHTVAMRIEGLAQIMRNEEKAEEKQLQSGQDISRDKDSDTYKLYEGDLATMSPERQVQIYQDLHQNKYVPAIKTMRMFEQLNTLTGQDMSAKIDLTGEIVKPSPPIKMAMQQGAIER